MLTKSDLSQIRTVVRDEVGSIVDEGDVKLDRRVRKIEEHLDLPTAY